MDFSFTQEQHDLYASTRDFAAKVVAPGAVERDRDGRFDRAVWDALAGQGLMGMPIPEEHGGAGGSIIDTCLVGEAIAEGGRDAGLMLSLGAHWVIGAAPIWLHGSAEQQKQWLPGLCDGTFIGSYAVTEPEVGSDAGSVRTTARRDGDDWIINGSKTFITNGPIADVCTVVARTNPDASSGTGISAFTIPTNTPGFSVGREIDKMGCRSSPTSEIWLEECRVPGDYMLGPEGEALWRITFECFDWERTVMVASALGGMKALLDETVAYAKARKQFGKPISSFQAIAHKLADMRINYEIARTMVYRAAWLKQEKKDHTLEASVAKTLMGKLTVENALEAIQIHGGNGYTRDFAPERALRDSKLLSIGGGTTEIQKMIISRIVLGQG